MCDTKARGRAGGQKRSDCRGSLTPGAACTIALCRVRTGPVAGPLPLSIQAEGDPSVLAL